MTGFSPKQLEVLRFPYRDERILICDGAIRSGKTVVMSLSFLLWAMAAFDGCSFAICGKTVRSAERNVIQPLLGVRYLREQFGMTYKISETVLTVTRGARVNRFYVFGGKDESSYALIQGITLAGVLLDEVALMPESFVQQAMARCSVEGARYWFNCNPEGREHWFHREWVEKAAERGALRLRFTMDDNPSLSDAKREEYRRLYHGVFYRRYILGEWCAAEGAIYDMFDAARHVRALPVEGCERYVVSCDYGTQNATVFLLWGLRGGVWHCLDEYYYSGREALVQKTDGQYLTDLRTFLGDIVPDAVIVDPSAASFIALLRQAGFAVVKARNDVVPGILRVANALTDGRVLVADRCVRTIAEFGSYVWDRKAADRGEDRPLKVDDHCMDAFRYFCSSAFFAGGMGILR